MSSILDSVMPTTHDHSALTFCKVPHVSPTQLAPPLRSSLSLHFSCARASSIPRSRQSFSKGKGSGERLGERGAGASSSGSTSGGGGGAGGVGPAGRASPGLGWGDGYSSGEVRARSL